MLVFTVGIATTFSARPGSSRLNVQAVMGPLGATPIPHPLLVSVTDESGQPVTDLVQADFEFRVFSDVVSWVG